MRSFNATHSSMPPPLYLLSLLFDLPRRILLDSAASFTSLSTTAIIGNKRTGVSYRGIAVSGVEHF